MDKNYADTVRLLLAVTPEVFANDIFAMKGGTAINLFVQDMPRLSVDIDVVYRPWQIGRDGFCAGQMGRDIKVSHSTYAKWMPGEADAIEMARLESALSSQIFTQKAV